MACAEEQAGETRQGRTDGHRPGDLHRDRRRRPTQTCDILGVGMFDSAEIRVHPTGSVIARMGTITQGQGHQTTYAQIIATRTRPAVR